MRSLLAAEMSAHRVVGYTNCKHSLVGSDLLNLTSCTPSPPTIPSTFDNLYNVKMYVGNVTVILSL